MYYGVQLGRYGDRYLITGVDVSEYQTGDKMIDWDILSKYVSFVGIRLGVAKNPDADAIYNILQAHNRNIPWLVYHVPRVGASNLTAQAEWVRDYLLFIQTTYGTPSVPPMGVWGDFERGGLYNSEISKVDFMNWTDKYILRLTDYFTRDKVGYYTSYGFWNQYYPTTGSDLPKYYKLWAAQYNDYISYPNPLPNKWENLNQGKKWNLWQWSADGNGYGDEFGCQSKSIDLNRYNGTVEEFYNDFGVYPKETLVNSFDDIIPPPPTPEEPKIFNIYKAKCLVNVLNVRSGPSTSYPIVEKIYLNDIVEVLDLHKYADNHQWIRIGKNQWAAMYYPSNYKYLEYVT